MNQYANLSLVLHVIGVSVRCLVNESTHSLSSGRLEMSYFVVEVKLQKKLVISDISTTRSIVIGEVFTLDSLGASVSLRILDPFDKCIRLEI